MKSSSALSPDQTTQMTEIIQRLLLLRPQLKAALPKDASLAQVQARLEASHPEGRSGSVADYGLLYHVGVILAQEQEPVTMGELSRALDVSLSTATRIVDWLVKNNFAERQSDPADRRVVRVGLTAAGQEMYRASSGYIRRRVEQLLHPFTSAEKKALIKLLNKLVQAFEEEFQ